MNDLSLCSLAQMNHTWNSLASYLDLSFSNINDVVISISVDPLLECDLYYPALTMQLHVHPSLYATFTNNNVTYKYDFKRGDYTGVCNYLNSIVWDDALKNTILDDAVCLLNSLECNFVFLYEN